MDKFDQSIKNSTNPVEPTNEFVDKTMSEITKGCSKKSWNVKIWAPVLVGSLAVIVVLFVALKPSTKTPINNTSTLTSSAQQPATTTTQSATATPATPAASTDNASLSSDLGSVQSSINQEAADQSNANSALNDSQPALASYTN